MLARQAGKVSGCVPGNILKSWKFSSHLNWPVPPSSDNNRNICPGTDNPLHAGPFQYARGIKIPGPENEIIQKHDFA
jgi:hypothetical protein